MDIFYIFFYWFSTSLSFCEMKALAIFVSLSLHYHTVPYYMWLPSKEICNKWQQLEGAYCSNDEFTGYDMLPIKKKEKEVLFCFCFHTTLWKIGVHLGGVFDVIGL